MDKWKCTVCRYVLEQEEVPKKCPHCHAGAEHKFKIIGKKLRKAHDLAG